MTGQAALRTTLVAALLVASAAWARAGELPMRRVAIVVGANAAPPGRKPLRYAHRDARQVASVLRDLGGFAGEDVSLLLDPSPSDILAALDGVLRGAARSGSETLVFFYYSGHADTGSLFPGGRPLAFAALRARLEDSRAAMRIGIIDACRGGGWTGAKGLSDAAVFDIDNALDLTTEGSVLIASSSGLEDAHESAVLRGSFFTHHWNAALRGAADRNGDDRVTINEAYEYARSLTIRDTALNTEAPQHPSFRFNLRGRGDPSLSELAAGTSVLEIEQRQGPVHVINLGTGLLVVELPAGQRRARVSLPPGRYAVRRRVGDRVLARVIQVGRGTRLTIDERSLVAQAPGQLAAKGDVPAVAAREADPDAPPPWELMIGTHWMGTSYHARVQDQYGEFGFRNEVSRWAFSGSYLLRMGRHLGTRLGLGVTGGGLRDEASLLVVVGETLSWPVARVSNSVAGLSSYAIEPYVSGELTAAVPFQVSDPAVDLQAAVYGGIRFYMLYAQFGYGIDLLPRGLYRGDDTYSEPDPGFAAQLGLRLVKNFE